MAITESEARGVQAEPGVLLGHRAAVASWVLTVSRVCPASVVRGVSLGSTVLRALSAKAVPLVNKANVELRVMWAPLVSMALPASPAVRVHLVLMELPVAMALLACGETAVNLGHPAAQAIQATWATLAFQEPTARTGTRVKRALTENQASWADLGPQGHLALRGRTEPKARGATQARGELRATAAGAVSRVCLACRVLTVIKEALVSMAAMVQGDPRAQRAGVARMGTTDSLAPSGPLATAVVQGRLAALALLVHQVSLGPQALPAPQQMATDCCP